MRRQRDDRDRAGVAAGLEGAGGRPTVEHRQVHVEKDHIGLGGAGLLNARLAVMRQHHLVAAALEAPGQEVPDLLVVLDQQNLARHARPSPLAPMRRVALTRGNARRSHNRRGASISPSRAACLYRSCGRPADGARVGYGAGRGRATWWGGGRSARRRPSRAGRCRRRTARRRGPGRTRRAGSGRAALESRIDPLAPPRWWAAGSGGLDLGGADLAEAKLEETDLSGANLRRARLGGVLARSAGFEGACLEEADFSEADLSGARFRGVAGGQADFGAAMLEDADFSEAVMRFASFRKALLDGARFPEPTCGAPTSPGRMPTIPCSAPPASTRRTCPIAT